MDITSGVMMADDKVNAGSAKTKRTYTNVQMTPRRTSISPTRKQAKKGTAEALVNKNADQTSLKGEMKRIINEILDEKFDHLSCCLEKLLETKILELEKKFEGVHKEIMDIKEDFNQSINHVEYVLKHDIDYTWEYCVKNEQYSRKNNLRILGPEEEPEENLVEKFITAIENEFGKKISSDKVEIIHRIRQQRKTDRTGKPRLVIVKFHSHKRKMKILVKRRQLKGKPLIIMEDMASDIAKRLKELKNKNSIERAWFTNGKIKYKQKDDPRVKELRYW